MTEIYLHFECAHYLLDALFGVACLLIACLERRHLLRVFVQLRLLLLRRHLQCLGALVILSRSRRLHLGFSRANLRGESANACPVSQSVGVSGDARNNM